MSMHVSSPVVSFATRRRLGALLLLTQAACFNTSDFDPTATAGETTGGDAMTDSDPSAPTTMSPSGSSDGPTGPTGDSADPTGDTDTMNPDSGNPEDDSDSGSSDESDSSSSDEAETADPGCGAGTMCLAVPAGWNGPIATHDAGGGAARPGCEGDFSEATVLAYEGLSADAANCSCTCVAPADLDCPATSELDQFDSNVISCAVQMVNDTFDLAPGCNELGFYDDAAMRLDVPALNLAGVSCDPQVHEMITPAGWDTQVAGCGLGAAPDTCDAGACIPTVAEGALCIWVDGDQTCPAGDFSEKRLLHRDLTDDRDCSACDCSDPEGECVGTVTLYAGTACSAGSPGSGEDGDCIGFATPTRSARLEYDAPDVSCTPSGGSAIGSASPTDAVTLCCVG